MSIDYSNMNFPRQSGLPEIQKEEQAKPLKLEEKVGAILSKLDIVSQSKKEQLESKLYKSLSKIGKSKTEGECDAAVNKCIKEAKQILGPLMDVGGRNELLSKFLKSHWGIDVTTLSQSSQNTMKQIVALFNLDDPKVVKFRNQLPGFMKQLDDCKTQDDFEKVQKNILKEAKNLGKTVMIVKISAGENTREAVLEQILFDHRVKTLPEKGQTAVKQIVELYSLNQEVNNKRAEFKNKLPGFILEIAQCTNQTDFETVRTKILKAAQNIGKPCEDILNSYWEPIKQRINTEREIESVFKELPPYNGPTEKIGKILSSFKDNLTKTGGVNSPEGKVLVRQTRRLITDSNEANDTLEKNLIALALEWEKQKG